MEWPTTLRDGTVAVLRPIEAADTDLIEAVFEGLSPQSRYTRFMSMPSHLNDAELRYFSDVDHHDHEAIVARSESGEPMGTARFIRLAPGSDTAEVAATVTDRWQGHGVATALLDRLTQRAREEQIARFRATAFATNKDMIDLLRRLGATEISRPDSGVVEMSVVLPAHAHPESPLRRMLRRAAAGDLRVRLPGGRHRR